MPQPYIARRRVPSRCPLGGRTAGVYSALAGYHRLMATYEGVGVSPGRVIGHVRTMPRAIIAPPADKSADPRREPDRLRGAVEAVQYELQRRALHAADAGKDEARSILEVTAQMASDPALSAAAEVLMRDGYTADYAIWQAGAEFADKLAALGGYMAERSGDVVDVRARIVARLRGEPPPGIPDSETPYILAAHDLAPADTAVLDAALVLGIVTSGGGPQSHTAILARALGLPAAVGVRGADELSDGDIVYLDGRSGIVTTDPGPAEAARVAAALSASVPEFDGTGRLGDGHAVGLLANIGTADEAQRAAASGAEGVGLFRTEFCFLGRDTEPSAGEQEDAYSHVFAAFAGRKVVIRTLDAGADKPLPFLAGGADEPNPALGIRGFRVTGLHADVIARQLDAIAAAAANTPGADVSVMAPMIATVEEARQFADMCGVAGLPVCGVMVEMPAAALGAASILRAVDFASLGTNDLTQYTMAADRELAELASLSDPWQPAVLRLVDQTSRGAMAAGGKPVGVCGEAAADPALAVVLVGLGVSTLSMSPGAIPAVSAVLRSTDLPTARRLASTAVDAESAAAGKAAVRAGLPVLDTLGL